jgi:Holliday junction resolvase RusA-like endonuclease
VVFEFFARGVPAAHQYRQTKFGVIYRKARVVTWQRTIAQEALIAAGPAFQPAIGRISLAFVFWFPIPKSRKDLIAGQVHLQDPDCTNLQKAAEDALKGVLIADDNLVYRVSTEKKWCAQGKEGVAVKVEIDE